jgi:hypothetical protein
MYDELPNVDRIYRLLNDIFLVRSAHDSRIELELYHKLVYIYRNPMVLMSVTRLSDKDIKNDFIYNKVF